MRIGTKLTWILDGRRPNQIPLARLAEYMQNLAVLFGEIDNVHFEQVFEGSTCLEAKIRPGIPSQRVQERVAAVRQKRAPADAMRAYHRLDEMVHEDRGPARLSCGPAIILRFPGKVIEKYKPASILERGTVVGRLYFLMEESPGQLRVRIRPRTGNAYVPCTADGSIGRHLRNYFMDAVRASGRGMWERMESGEWSCRSLHIDDVQPVKDSSLREAINALRNVEAHWSDDPLAEWLEIEERSGAA